MKKLFLILFLPLAASAASFRQVPKEVQPVVQKVLRMPEARILLEQISQDGPIDIVASSSYLDGFSAMWDGGQRRIMLGNVRGRSQASLARSLLMEMHNASTNRRLLQLGQMAKARKIGKWDYVRGVERIEHQNLLKTLILMQRAQRRGVFVYDANWYCPKRFPDYFQMQLASGHSQWIARKYDCMQA